MVYKVLWLPLWRKLSIHMIATVSVSVLVVLAVRYVASGFDSEKTLQHISFSSTPLIFLGVSAFCVFLSLLVSALVGITSIEISNGNLIGRNYWLLRKTIPLSKITRIYPFSNNGIDAIVADGDKTGKIYISTFTENIDEILEVIESNMNKSKA